MAKMTPRVEGGQLYLDGAETAVCALESPDWFVWLETAVSFRYHSRERRIIIYTYGPVLEPVSLRKEQRRRGFLWYAYKRNHGLLYKRYAGRSAALTKARLEELALELNQLW